MENINSEVIEKFFEAIQKFADLCSLKIVSSIPPEIKYTPMSGGRYDYAKGQKGIIKLADTSKIEFSIDFESK